MKIMLLILILAFCLTLPDKKTATNRKITFAADTINYQKQILPILENKCSPCHFTGGKMYEKMPFDKGETILSHRAGVLKRIHEADKKSLVERYIKQNAR